MSFYDNLNNEVKTVYERCREYYAPEEFVIIMNIDSEDFTYQMARPENVQIINPSSVTKELYYTKDPETITLPPSGTRLAPAYEADYFIKQLMDKIILRNRAKIIETGVTPQESAMDPQTQHRYIQAIFQGKRDFMSEYNKQMVAQAAPQQQETHEPETAAQFDPWAPKAPVAQG